MELLLLRGDTLIHPALSYPHMIRGVKAVESPLELPRLRAAPGRALGLRRREGR